MKWNLAINSCDTIGIQGIPDCGRGDGTTRGHGLVLGCITRRPRCDTMVVVRKGDERLAWVRE